MPAIRLLGLGVRRRRRLVPNPDAGESQFVDVRENVLHRIWELTIDNGNRDPAAFCRVLSLHLSFLADQDRNEIQDWHGSSKSSSSHSSDAESSSSAAAAAPSPSSPTVTPSVSSRAAAVTRAYEDFDRLLESSGDLRRHQRTASSSTASSSRSAALTATTSNTSTTAASSSGSSTATEGNDIPRRLRRTREALTVHRESRASSMMDTSMLTLDEFLRETSRPTQDPEHQLTLLLIHRRDDNQRGTGMSPATEAAQNLWRRTVLEQAGASRHRVQPSHGWTSSIPEGSPMQPMLTEPLTFANAGLVAPPVAESVASVAATAGGDSVSSSTSTTGAVDEFDTIVSQIRRAGGMEEYLNVGDLDAPVTSQELSMVSHGNPRSAVANLRVREARLRVLQTRMELLASEFAFLHNASRDVRRAEVEALRSPSPSVSGAATVPTNDNATSTPTPATTVPWNIGTNSPAITPQELAAIRRIEARRAAADSEDNNSRSLRRERRPRVALPPPPPPPPPPAPIQPISIDRRSCILTNEERRKMLRDALMQMQIQKLH
ncbi:hypothetical protein EDC01DRAFT_730558 [Geopyxis carbonaria]|nr:hypothetical protein EDC01DRAFT_730558 [Geopyxis carbonaria]